MFFAYKRTMEVVNFC